MADDAKNLAALSLSDKIASCKVCESQESLKRCAKCKTVYYCTREHQTQDWRNHKTDCKKLAAQVSTSEDTTSKTSSATNVKTEQHAVTSIENKQPKPTEIFDNSHFDDRPYKPSDFDIPESYDIPELRKHVANGLKQAAPALTI